MTEPVALQDLIENWINENGLSNHFHIYNPPSLIDWIGLTCMCPVVNLHNFLSIKTDRVMVHSSDFELKDTSTPIMAADKDFFSKLLQAMMAHCNGSSELA